LKTPLCILVIAMGIGFSAGAKAQHESSALPQRTQWQEEPSEGSCMSQVPKSEPEDKRGDQRPALLDTENMSWPWVCAGGYLGLAVGTACTAPFGFFAFANAVSATVNMGNSDRADALFIATLIGMPIAMIGGESLGIWLASTGHSDASRRRAVVVAGATSILLGGATVGLGFAGFNNFPALVGAGITGILVLVAPPIFGAWAGAAYEEDEDWDVGAPGASRLDPFDPPTRVTSKKGMMF
jgi:opacity protein-like surface antigen